MKDPPEATWRDSSVSKVSPRSTKLSALPPAGDSWLMLSSEKATVAKNGANKERFDSQEQLEGDSWGTAAETRWSGHPKQSSLTIWGHWEPLLLSAFLVPAQ